MPNNPTNHHLKPSPMAVAVHGSFKPPIWNRRCRLRSFPHPDPSLLDLDSSPPNFHRSLSTPCFSSSTTTTSADDASRVEIVSGRRSISTHALVVEAAIAMASGSRPVPVSQTGDTGAYYLRNRAGDTFAVVKPVDEEPLAVSILGRQATRRSVRAGETGFREVAAYLLDHGGFSGVPPTALIKIYHSAFNSSTASPRRMASIQRFVPHDFNAGELGPSRFSVASVHRIGILDVRLLNIDRHAGNILVKRPPAAAVLRGSVDGFGCCGDVAVTELVPIDHGLCLPELLDDPYFEWLHWPQAAVPFSEAEVEYISALDPFKDAALLRKELPGLRDSAIRILVLCTVFLKRAAAAGLCLADIGDMMTREWSGMEEGPSALEALVEVSLSDGLRRRSTFSSSEDDDDEDVRISRSSSSKDNGSREFQFSMDCDADDGGSLSEGRIEDVLDIPLLVSSRTPVRSVGEDHGGMLVPVKEEDVICGEAESKVVVGGIAKCVSFSAADFNCEAGGGSGSGWCVSFKGLSEEEWRVFLERFEQLLPEALEARKYMGLKHERLGTSCKF